MRTIEHHVAGAATTGATQRYGRVSDPATGRQQAGVALAEPSDVDGAVAAARKAFESWQDPSLPRRARLMFAFRDLLERYEDDLAKLVTAEHGKVLEDARGEVVRGREVVEFACGIPALLKGGSSARVSAGVDPYWCRQPLGVCAGITPFNFPVMVPMWMHPVAIACGNTFVLKPSERDPSASNLVASLYAEAGLPDGVFNVVHGDKVAVDAILDHPDIEAVSFVGSTPIARYVHERAGTAGKRIQAVGGSKNPAVVLPDADLDDAARQITAAAYGSAGQRCMAISAVVAVGEAADPLVDKLSRAAGAIRVGPGRDPASEMGPVVTAEARDRVRRYLESGENAGAPLVADGRRVQTDSGSRGFFVGASRFDRVTPGLDGSTDQLS